MVRIWEEDERIRRVLTQYRIGRCCRCTLVSHRTGSTDGRIDSLEARERTLESLDIEHVACGDSDLVHEDGTGDGGPERDLVLDLRCRESLELLLAPIVSLRPQFEEDDVRLTFSMTKPRILPSHWHLAQTTNTSAMGELEIQVLAPEMMNPPPPGASRASVVIPAGSDPWSGSVSPCETIESATDEGGEGGRTHEASDLDTLGEVGKEPLLERIGTELVCNEVIESVGARS
jgi:hypothetical protein